MRRERLLATLEATQGQILSQSPTDAVAFVWELTKETIVLPLGCLRADGSSMKRERLLAESGRDGR